ncbi:hypothetical protein EDB89DRAFT_1907501 [Lactarius sanguifluus]|nr:hypothetical protein EDB89DRAFT_1907501 [Lactarius sanguifluus]
MMGVHACNTGCFEYGTTRSRRWASAQTAGVHHTLKLSVGRCAIVTAKQHLPCVSRTTPRDKWSLHSLSIPAQNSKAAFPMPHDKLRSQLRLKLPMPFRITKLRSAQGAFRGLMLLAESADPHQWGVTIVFISSIQDLRGMKKQHGQCTRTPDLVRLQGDSILAVWGRKSRDRPPIFYSLQFPARGSGNASWRPRKLVGNETQIPDLPVGKLPSVRLLPVEMGPLIWHLHHIWLCLLAAVPAPTLPFHAISGPYAL